MILNMVYLVVGLLIGFLVKHEIDIRQRQKKIQNQQRAISKAVSSYDETLSMIRELNESLLLIQQQNKKREVH
jgi:uncharacterized membrane-anchored protein YhcB (DUF1043 family)